MRNTRNLGIPSPPFPERAMAFRRGREYKQRNPQLLTSPIFLNLKNLKRLVIVNHRMELGGSAPIPLNPPSLQQEAALRLEKGGELLGVDQISTNPQELTVGSSPLGNPSGIQRA